MTAVNRKDIHQLFQQELQREFGTGAANSVLCENCERDRGWIKLEDSNNHSFLSHLIRFGS